MKVNFKYFKITKEKDINDIKEFIKSKERRFKSICDIAQQFGATNFRMQKCGHVESFFFDEKPSNKIWKKVRFGYMPKSNTNEAKTLLEVPIQNNINEIIRRYFNDNSFVDDDHLKDIGFKVHSPFILGNNGSFFVLSVPYRNEFNYDIDASLVEIKENEALTMNLIAY